MRYYNKTDRKPVLSGREVAVIDVFAAACAAQRLNKGFTKKTFIVTFPVVKMNVFLQTRISLLNC